MVQNSEVSGMNGKLVIAHGDCHGDAEVIVSTVNYYVKSLGIMPSDVVVIVAGDFGIPWPGYPQENTNKLDTLNKIGCEIVAVLGNHEWWTLIDAMPERQFMGASTHDCVYCGIPYRHVHYVSEPTVMTIDDKKYMLIPGADSHDIQDGVISYMTPIKEYETFTEWSSVHACEVLEFEETFKNRYGRRPHYRIEGVNWFRQESMKLWELHDIVDDNKSVHAIISHDMPSIFAAEWQKMLPRFMWYDTYESELALDKVYTTMDFNHWVHGHFHLDRVSLVDKRVAISYYEPIVISDNIIID